MFYVIFYLQFDCLHFCVTFLYYVFAIIICLFLFYLQKLLTSRLIHSTSPVYNADVKENYIKCTLIPGDGVGPELCQAVKEVLAAMQTPVVFEEMFLR